jgi:hypothetical protein
MAKLRLFEEQNWKDNIWLITRCRDKIRQKLEKSEWFDDKKRYQKNTKNHGTFVSGYLRGEKISIVQNVRIDYPEKCRNLRTTDTFKKNASGPAGMQTTILESGVHWNGDFREGPCLRNTPLVWRVQERNDWQSTELGCPGQPKWMRTTFPIYQIKKIEVDDFIHWLNTKIKG